MTDHDDSDDAMAVAFSEAMDETPGFRDAAETLNAPVDDAKDDGENTAQGPSDDAPRLEEIGSHVGDFLNGIQSELKEKGEAVSMSGTITIRLGKGDVQTVRLQLVEDLTSSDGSLHVHVDSWKGNNPPEVRRASPRSPNDQYQLGQDLSEDIQPRLKKRKLSQPNDDDLGHGDPAAKATPGPSEPKDVADMTSDELEQMLSKNRDDIQTDTVDAVNQTNRILRKFHEQWRDHVAWLVNKGVSTPAMSAMGSETVTRTQNGRAMVVPQQPASQPRASFPQAGDPNSSPALSRPSPSAPTALQLSQLSKQIRWLEDCRRIAAEVHDKREETWRISSASFHDSSRRDRETHEKHMSKEMAEQKKMLSDLMNEVRHLNTLTYSLKFDGSSGSQGPPFPQSPATAGPPPQGQRPPQRPQQQHQQQQRQQATPVSRPATQPTPSHNTASWRQYQGPPGRAGNASNAIPTHTSSNAGSPQPAVA